MNEHAAISFAMEEWVFVVEEQAFTVEEPSRAP